VSDEKQVIRALGRIKHAFLAVDGLVNNAATTNNCPLARLTRKAWDRALAVNLTGPFLLAKHAVPLFRMGKGTIVNICSTRAFMSEANTEAYSASKGGLFALTHALAVSLGPAVRVNSISPGWIETSAFKKSLTRKIPILSQADHAQHPAGRVGTPDDIADMALYLLSRKAGFITGQNFIVDGGMTKKMIYV
jgi:NAD(P)-dependent dehydrogenase (short-subunit alcohol dehydrogenase family)